MLVLLRFKQDNIPHTCTCSYIKYIFFILAKKTSIVAANYNDELVGTILSSVLNEIVSDSESEHEVDTASITPHFLQCRWGGLKWDKRLQNFPST